MVNSYDITANLNIQSDVFRRFRQHCQQQGHNLDQDSIAVIATIIWFPTDVSESDRLAMECGECGANAIIGRQGVAAR